jgi:hypothetical protein
VQGGGRIRKSNRGWIWSKHIICRYGNVTVKHLCIFNVCYKKRKINKGISEKETLLSQLLFWKEVSVSKRSLTMFSWSHCRVPWRVIPVRFTVTFLVAQCSSVSSLKCSCFLSFFLAQCFILKFLGDEIRTKKWTHFPLDLYFLTIILNPPYKNRLYKNKFARHQWLTPVILTTQEAEIRRIAVQSQPGQIVPGETPSRKTLNKKGLVEWLKV